MNSLMLVRRGHVIAEGWWAPYTAEAPHMLFSLSKSFTSTAIGLLVDDGQLSVDDAVLSFFPDDAPADPSDNLKAMRVRHLLSMSTGHAEDTLGPHMRGVTGSWVRAILSQPVTYAPGTHFVYNSGATHLLAAIVQRITGGRLSEFLRQRLYEPLGMTNVSWRTDPHGIDLGGWGMNGTTEDIAKLGHLYLQKGMWRGQRILSEAWVSEATATHVSNANPDDPYAPLDWQQGYGYQFWRCQPEGAYRGDGAFGQYCVVMPDQDAVLAITSGVKNMQHVLDVVWEHVLPNLSSTTNAAGLEKSDLPQQLSHLTLTSQPGHAFSPVASRVSGRRYALDSNAWGIAAMTFAFHNGRCTLTVHDAHGEQSIACGYRGWLQGATAFHSNDGTRATYAASAAWASDEAYVVKLFYTETPFMNTLQCTFDGDALHVVLSSHVAFGPNEPTHLKGHITP